MLFLQTTSQILTGLRRPRFREETILLGTINTLQLHLSVDQVEQVILLLEDIMVCDVLKDLTQQHSVKGNLILRTMATVGILREMGVLH
jgi:hypothetical protein